MFSFKSETWQKYVYLASKYYLLDFFLYGFTIFNLNKYENLMAATGDSQLDWSFVSIIFYFLVSWQRKSEYFIKNCTEMKAEAEGKFQQNLKISLIFVFLAKQNHIIIKVRCMKLFLKSCEKNCHSNLKLFYKSVNRNKPHKML